MEIADKVKQDICNMDPKSETAIKISKYLSTSELGCVIRWINRGLITDLNIKDEICTGKVFQNQDRSAYDKSVAVDCRSKNRSHEIEIRRILLNVTSKYIRNKEMFMHNKRKFQYVNDMIRNYCQLLVDSFDNDEEGNQYTNGAMTLPNGTSMEGLGGTKVEPNMNGDQVLKCVQKKMPDIKSIFNDVCDKYVNYSTIFGSPDICRHEDLQEYIRDHYTEYWVGDHLITHYFRSGNWSLPPPNEVNLWYQTLKECINPEPYVIDDNRQPYPHFCNYRMYSKISNASSYYVSASGCYFKGPSMADVDKNSSYERCRKLIFSNMASIYDKEYILCDMYYMMLFKVAVCMDLDWMGKDRELFNNMLVREFKHHVKCIDDSHYDAKNIYDHNGNKITTI